MQRQQIYILIAFLSICLQHCYGSDIISRSFSHNWRPISAYYHQYQNEPVAAAQTNLISIANLDTANDYHLAQIAQHNAAVLRQYNQRVVHSNGQHPASIHQQSYRYNPAPVQYRIYQNMVPAVAEPMPNLQRFVSQTLIKHEQNPSRVVYPKMAPVTSNRNILLESKQNTAASTLVPAVSPNVIFNYNFNGQKPAVPEATSSASAISNQYTKSPTSPHILKPVSSKLQFQIGGGYNSHQTSFLSNQNGDYVSLKPHIIHPKQRSPFKKQEQILYPYSQAIKPHFEQAQSHATVSYFNNPTTVNAYDKYLKPSPPDQNSISHYSVKEYEPSETAFSTFDYTKLQRPPTTTTPSPTIPPNILSHFFQNVQAQAQSHLVNQSVNKHQSYYNVPPPVPVHQYHFGGNNDITKELFQNNVINFQPSSTVAPVTYALQIKDDYTKDLVPPPIFKHLDIKKLAAKPTSSSVFSRPSTISFRTEKYKANEVLKKLNITAKSPLQDANKFSYHNYATLPTIKFSDIPKAQTINDNKNSNTISFPKLKANAYFPTPDPVPTFSSPAGSSSYQPFSPTIIPTSEFRPMTTETINAVNFPDEIKVESNFRQELPNAIVKDFKEPINESIGEELTTVSPTVLTETVHHARVRIKTRRRRPKPRPTLSEVTEFNVSPTRFTELQNSQNVEVVPLSTTTKPIDLHEIHQTNVFENLNKDTTLLLNHKPIMNPRNVTIIYTGQTKPIEVLSESISVKPTKASSTGFTILYKSQRRPFLTTTTASSELTGGTESIQNTSEFKSPTEVTDEQIVSSQNPKEVSRFRFSVKRFKNRVKTTTTPSTIEAADNIITSEGSDQGVRVSEQSTSITKSTQGSKYKDPSDLESSTTVSLSINEISENLAPKTTAAPTTPVIKATRPTINRQRGNTTRTHYLHRSRFTTLAPITTTTSKPTRITVSIRNSSIPLRRPQIQSLKERINKRKKEQQETTTTMSPSIKDINLMNVNPEQEDSTSEINDVKIETKPESAIMKITKTDKTFEKTLKETMKEVMPQLTAQPEQPEMVDQSAGSSELSERIADLTTSYKQTHFNSLNVGANSRQVPNYFTIATEEPMLPIQAFFPGLKTDDQQ